MRLLHLLSLDSEFFITLSLAAIAGRSSLGTVQLSTLALSCVYFTTGLSSVDRGGVRDPVEISSLFRAGLRPLWPWCELRDLDRDGVSDPLE